MLSKPYLVEVAGLELAASSSRRDVYMFFAHNYLHIVRIFRQNDPYLTNASAISVQKNSVDGQRCGQAAKPNKIKTEIFYSLLIAFFC